MEVVATGAGVEGVVVTTGGVLVDIWKKKKRVTVNRGICNEVKRKTHSGGGGANYWGRRGL